MYQGFTVTLGLNILLGKADEIRCMINREAHSSFRCDFSSYNRSLVIQTAFDSFQIIHEKFVKFTAVMFKLKDVVIISCSLDNYQLYYKWM